MPYFKTVQHIIDVSDHDRLILHENRPDGWRETSPTALLVHGLAGSHGSGYLLRLTGKMLRAGMRVFRLDQRACGAGYLLAKLPYHSGRSDDIAAALTFIAGLSASGSTSEVALVAFSLGANTALKWASEAGSDARRLARRVIAVSPPIDLATCVMHLAAFPARLYDRHFVSLLLSQVGAHPHFKRHRFARRPRTLREFDDAFTAPMGGFDDAEHYYRACSAGRMLGTIRIPTLILAAKDDPIVPHAPLASAPANVTVHLEEHGGHLGFIGTRGGDSDRRWMDWRILEQVAAALPERDPQ